MQLLGILAVAMVASVLGTLQTASVSQSVLISETAVMISTAHAVRTLADRHRAWPLITLYGYECFSQLRLRKLQCYNHFSLRQFLAF